MQKLPVHQSDSHSYLLRLWRTGPRLPYHASLRCIGSEQFYHFATVEALVAFLVTQLPPAGDWVQGLAEETHAPC